MRTFFIYSNLILTAPSINLTVNLKKEKNNVYLNPLGALHDFINRNWTEHAWILSSNIFLLFSLKKKRKPKKNLISHNWIDNSKLCTNTHIDLSSLFHWLLPTLTPPYTVCPLHYASTLWLDDLQLFMGHLILVLSNSKQSMWWVAS